MPNKLGSDIRNIVLQVNGKSLKETEADEIFVSAFTRNFSTTVTREPILLLSLLHEESACSLSSLICSELAVAEAICSCNNQGRIQRGGGAKGSWPLPNCWIIMLHHLFNQARASTHTYPNLHMHIHTVCVSACVRARV